MISAQAHMRLANLRHCVKTAEHLSPNTAILVRIDEQPDPSQSIVRFVVLRQEMQNGSRNAPAAAAVPNDLPGELAALSAAELMEGMHGLVALKHPKTAPRFLSYEIETRKRLEIYDRSLKRPRTPLENVTEHLPPAFVEAMIAGDFSEANRIIGAFTRVVEKAIAAPPMTGAVVDSFIRKRADTVERAQMFLRSLASTLDPPFAVTEDHVCGLVELLELERDRAQ